MPKQNRFVVTVVSVALILAVLSLGAIQASKLIVERQHREAQCTLGREVLKTALTHGPRQGFRLSTEAPEGLRTAARVGMLFDDQNLLRMPGSVGPGPSSVLTKEAFAAVGTTLIDRCPRLRAAVLASGGSVGPSYPARVLADGSFAESMASVSAPTISADGKDALIVVETTFGRLAGGGQLEYWKKTDAGEWRLFGFFGLWIS